MSSSRLQGLGYITEADKSAHRVVDFGKRKQARLEDSYSFLRQWELGRFFVPQGPLDPRDLDEDLLQEWSRLPLDRLYDALKRLSATKDKYSKIPASLPPSFWRALQGGGGEIACERAGTLVYRAAIKSDAYKPRFELAPPIVGASRRLWRHFPTRRLLRVSLDERTEWLLCSKKSKDREVKAMFLSWLRVPILHLGQYYRCFFHKRPGTLYFFSVSSYLEAYETLSLTSFLETLIPREHGKNNNMTLGKYSARISLWLSKTSVVCRVEQIRWVPDIDNWTLPISREVVRDIAHRLRLSYIPSCISGFVRGQLYTWCIRHDVPANKIGAYASEMEIDHQNTPSLSRAGTGADKTLLHCNFMIKTGFKGKTETCKMSFRRADIQFYDVPMHNREIMTDGNAMMSYTLAEKIRDREGLEAIPSAVQGRIGGSKGMWNLEEVPNVADPCVWIEIRDSQHKYIEASSCAWDFEVVNTSMPSRSSSYGEQMTRVLRATQSEENAGRIEQRLHQLSDLATEKISTCLFDIKDRAVLRKNIEVVERVQQWRESSERNEVRKSGFKGREMEDEFLFSEAELYEPAVDPNSGRPRSWAERAIAFLDAGFDSTDPMLASLLDKIWKRDVQATVKAGKILIPNSRYLYVIADHWGFLEHDQIFCQISGDGIIDPSTRLRFSNVLQGKVLLSRSPCIQPTDIQLVWAVHMPALQGFHDVVVVSTKGKRSIMTALSGGDFDGDCVHVVFDSILVSCWENAPEKFLVPPYSEDDFFEEQAFYVGKELVRTVQDFEESRARQKIEDASSEIQSVLLASLFVEPAYAMLSECQKSLLQMHGIFHELTCIAGHLYCQALDAAKASKIFKLSNNAVLKRLGLLNVEITSNQNLSLDQGSIEQRTRARDDVDEGSSDESGSLSPTPAAIRKHQSALSMTSNSKLVPSLIVSPSRMNQVAEKSGKGTGVSPLFPEKSAAEKSSARKDNWLGRTESSLRLNDLDIPATWKQAVARGGVRKTGFIAQLESHVRACMVEYEQIYKPALRTTGDRDSPAKLRTSIMHDEKAKRQALIEQFYTLPPIPEGCDLYFVKRLAASCAYDMASIRGHYFNDFPCLVAFRYILDIKADAVESRNVDPRLPARKVVTESFLSLTSRARLRKGVIHESTEISSIHKTATYSPVKKRKEYSESGGKDTDSEYEEWLNAIEEDSGIGGSQEVPEI